MMPHAKMELPYENAKKMVLVDNVENKTILKKLFEAMFDELPEKIVKKKKK